PHPLVASQLDATPGVTAGPGARQAGAAARPGGLLGGTGARPSAATPGGLVSAQTAARLASLVTARTTAPLAAGDPAVEDFRRGASRPECHRERLRGRLDRTEARRQLRRGHACRPERL